MLGTNPKGRSTAMLTILLIVLVLLLLLGGFGYSRRGRRGV
jgi:flagellar basal body-associated protein FliL